MLLAKFIHINMDKIKRPKLYTLPDALSRQTSPAAGTIYQAWAVWQRVQRLGVCAGAWCGLPWHLPALVLARPALLPVICSLSGCAGVLGSPPAGYTAAAQPRPVSPVTTEKIKKAQNTPPPISQVPKISRKNKKTPTKGLCSVLYLPYKP